MAEDILVKESLTDQMITAGARLIKRLDYAMSDIRSAFWLYIPESNSWKLIIASPIAVSEGPRSFYKRIVEENEKADTDEAFISLNDITVTGTENQMVQLFTMAIKTNGGISGIRFSRNTINGVFIEDAYIYRTGI
ncbi:MAG: hypothetical protein ACFCUM_10370 [Bacteroidales bacterium]